MSFKIDIDSLKDVYLVSNTPLYLYKNFVNDQSVQELKLSNTTQELVEEFIHISNIEIEEIDDLVYAYAIYIAILLKDDNLTNTFIDSAGDINFEWFGDLKSIYEETITPTYSFEIKENYSRPTKNIKQSSEDNINDLELEMA